MNDAGVVVALMRGGLRGGERGEHSDRSGANQVREQPAVHRHLIEADRER
jgi:hypothetical protein